MIILHYLLLIPDGFFSLNRVLVSDCAASCLRVCGIFDILGFGNTAGCLIDCSIFSAASCNNDLRLDFGRVIWSNLLAANSVSDFGFDNLDDTTVFGLAMNLALFTHVLIDPHLLLAVIVPIAPFLIYS